MKPIRQLASHLTSLQPQRLSATPAARTLRSVARQARQAVRQYLPKRHPGTPAPTPARDNCLNGHDCLTDLKASHQRNIEENEKLRTHAGLASVEAMRKDIVNQHKRGLESGAGTQQPVPAPAPEPVTVRPQAVPVVDTGAQLKALTDAHAAITADMLQARVNAMQDLQARSMTKGLQQATEAIAAIPDRAAGEADADSAHLEALKGYEARLKAAYRDGVVLAADLLAKGASDKALDPLMQKLAAQQKAVAAYIRLLEA